MWREDTTRLPSESPKQRPHACFIAAAKPVVRCPGGDDGSIVGLLVYNSMPSVEDLCKRFKQVNTPEDDKPEVFALSFFKKASLHPSSPNRHVSRTTSTRTLNKT